jgi:ribosomal protein L33
MFTELGMSNSSFLTNYMAVIPQKARPYGSWNGWREYPSITEIHGDGALFTTLADQLKWEQIIQRNDGSLVKKELLDKSQSVVSNSTTDKYGYGLMFDQYQGLDYLFHDGNTGAYNATFFRFPHKNLAIVIMANNGNVSTTYLARQLTDIVFDLQESDAAVYQASPDRIEKLKNIQSVLGNYQQADGTVIRITAKEGAIYREIYQREPVKLVSEKGGLFHYETNEDLKLNFTNIDKTDQQSTLYLSSHAPSTFYKQADLNLDKTTLNGEFYNDETDTEIIIKHTEGNSYTITKNGRERKAELILKDYLRMMSSYEINAIRDHKNEVISLSVNNSRIKNVIFHKK